MGALTPSSSPATDCPEETSKSFLANLVERMNPQTCLGINHTSSDDFDAMVMAILDDLKSENSRSSALERLYNMSDANHKYNRIPMVCTSEWNITESLTECISYESDRRMTLLILNDLSIPFENKAVMCLGPSSNVLLDAVLKVIQNGENESYLCCILLMNLSFLEDARIKLVEYKGGLDDSKSLLRTMELLLKTYSQFLGKKVLSVEGEAVRWTTGLLRNLTSTKQGAIVVSQTDIPSLILSYVRDSNKPLHEWTLDSLEDLSLQVLVNLATHEQSAECLKLLKAQHAFDFIVNQAQEGSIHVVRASFLQIHLQ